MGNCDSSIESRTKHISKLCINNDYSTNLSSPSLPFVSSKIIQNNNINNNNKRSI